MGGGVANADETRHATLEQKDFRVQHMNESAASELGSHAV